MEKTIKPMKFKTKAEEDAYLKGFEDGLRREMLKHINETSALKSKIAYLEKKLREKAGIGVESLIDEARRIEQ